MRWRRVAPLVASVTRGLVGALPRLMSHRGSGILSGLEAAGEMHRIAVPGSVGFGVPGCRTPESSSTVNQALRRHHGGGLVRRLICRSIRAKELCE